MRTESLVVSAGRPEEPGEPVNAPIVLTAPYRYKQDADGYARAHPTETRAALEAAVGELEGGTALVFASGMAAIAAIAEGQPAGTVAVVPHAGYSGAVSIFAHEHALGRMTLRRVDPADTAEVIGALDGAGLLWLESVSNPLMVVPDLPVLIAAAHDAGATVCVDATFNTPLGLRALDLGADIVMQSATKYLNGHSDVLMGTLATRSEALLASLTARRTLTGAIPGGLESYLALRGLRTLALRWERAQSNAGDLAQRLVDHPRVSQVRYPGLPNDPGHALAAQLFTGFGAMIGIEVIGGIEEADRVCDRVRLITHATSLGGVESLIERRARYDVDAAFGTPPNLLRLSVGIEHVDDLWDDLSQALG